jgi:hypothetical protein
MPPPGPLSGLAFGGGKCIFSNKLKEYPPVSYNTNSQLAPTDGRSDGVGMICPLFLLSG